MTTHRRHKGIVSYPSELDIAVTRHFDAPLQLVYDVLTKPELLTRTLAPFDTSLTEWEFDVRIGGDYRYTFQTPEGVNCSFRGRYLEIDPPTHTAATWIFEGWPGVEAIETFDLSEENGVTAMVWKLAFASVADRAHMSKTDGLEDNMDQIEDLIWELLDQQPTNR
ncbi:MAG TPA: SRPBCC domain-containing protein [Acidimicrobiales bacterium]